MATFYISPTGNDTTGNGSSATPYQSISKVDAVCANGDTIICKDGTYTMEMFRKIAFTHYNLTIQAENTGLAIFDGGSSDTYTVIWYERASQDPTTYFNITGIAFQNFGSSTGLALNAQSYGNWTYTNCTFTNMLGRTDGGALLGTTNLGVHTWVYKYVGCLFNNVHGGSGIGLFHLTTWGFYLTMSSCTLYDDNLRVITRNGGSEPVVLDCKSNIFFSTNSAAFINSQTAVSGTYNNNCNYVNTQIPTGSNNITSDPLFVDAANANFNLRPTSPCVDTGTII